VNIGKDHPPEETVQYFGECSPELLYNGSAPRAVKQRTGCNQSGQPVRLLTESNNVSRLPGAGNLNDATLHDLRVLREARVVECGLHH
jgi:hypothetical protein